MGFGPAGVRGCGFPGHVDDHNNEPFLYFFHELEHVAKQSLDPDRNYSKDLANINTECQPKDIPVEPPDNVGGLRP